GNERQASAANDLRSAGPANIARKPPLRKIETIQYSAATGRTPLPTPREKRLSNPSRKLSSASNTAPIPVTLGRNVDATPVACVEKLLYQSESKPDRIRSPARLDPRESRMPPIRIAPRMPASRRLRAYAAAT